jgi:NAD(P)-dependent dehydrogenase (short-subunit alcohol dehydrogenase family)
LSLNIARTAEKAGKEREESMRLMNKVAAITGGAAGLGKATAELFAREGAMVVIADVDADAGEETARGIRDAGGRAAFVRTNVASEADACRMVETAVGNFGGLDVLVNNAGIQVEKAVPETTEEEWDRVLDVNLKGCFLCSKHAIIQMRKQGGGNIVCVSSQSGLVSNSNQASYNASKHGIIGLAKCMAHDHARDGIRVNAICPGSIANTRATARLSEEHLAPFRKANMLERFSEPAEIANCILFLTSDESSFVTGAVLVADGGYTTK